MEGKSKRRVMSPRKGEGKSMSLMTMWGLAPPPVVQTTAAQPASTTAQALKPHPFLMPRSAGGSGSGGSLLDLTSEEQVWRAQDAAVPGPHVNWGTVQHMPLAMEQRVETPDEPLADSRGSEERIAAMLAVQSEVEALERREFAAALAQETEAAGRLSLREGALECWRRANAVMPQHAEDSAERAAERAEQMRREGRLMLEEWVHEAPAKQVEQWLREWERSGQEKGNDRDDDDWEEDGGLPGALALSGPVGSGKSGLLERAASFRGWRLLEVNGGDVRSGRSLQASVSEATQSARAGAGEKTVLVLEDCAADLGDAGFAAAVETLLLAARVPVAVVLEDSHPPARWAVSRVIITHRPEESPRALLWALLAAWVGHGRLLGAEEALLWLRHSRWDLRSAFFSLRLQRAGPVWPWLGRLPALCLALHGSLHSALAQVTSTASVISPSLLRVSREALARRTGVATLWQYWPLCSSSSLELAELCSLAGEWEETSACGLAALAARQCAGRLVDDEEVEARDPDGDSATPLPRSCLSAVFFSSGRSGGLAGAELLGWAGLLARFEGAGRRGATSCYLARAAPLLTAADRALLLRCAAFSKE